MSHTRVLLGSERLFSRELLSPPSNPLTEHDDESHLNRFDLGARDDAARTRPLEVRLVLAVAVGRGWRGRGRARWIAWAPWHRDETRRKQDKEQAERR